ncbi:MAG: acyltransferase [Candidatus Omnitrophica bacterium]|nr:acyltransferase [Candidatus Omnitrophota bacterium]
MFKYYPWFVIGRIYCSIKGVQFGSNLQTYGLPLINKHKQARITLGDNVVLTSLLRVNLAGINHRLILAAPARYSEIYIGNNSGISGGVIYACSSVRIGNYVNIGVNVRIYDTDFHSMDYEERRIGSLKNVKSQPIVIEDDVWIGANSIILKGVTIGKGAVVGAGSVVTKNIPSFTLWAGNPARFIRNLK